MIIGNVKLLLKSRETLIHSYFFGRIFEVEKVCLGYPCIPSYQISIIYI